MFNYLNVNSCMINLGSGYLVADATEPAYPSMHGYFTGVYKDFNE